MPGHDTKHISRAFRNAETLEFDDFSGIVLMSDCHRGYGGWADNFAINEDTYFAALRFYDSSGFTYIELGDGDELWENRKFSEIAATHNHVFWLLRNMWLDGRFIMLYGNHDVEKKFKPKLMNSYYGANERRELPLFPGMKVKEAVRLRHRVSGAEFLLIHGHQADFFNDGLWKLSRFLVRYIWKSLQNVGLKAPARGSYYDKNMDDTEERLSRWTRATGTPLIAGHTHRPRFPGPGETPYFNDGSCVHPRCITAVEIANGAIRLVKWSHKTRSDGVLYVGRDTVSGPYAITDYMQAGGLER
ncbi:MAG: serine/threonine protein phosphatase [Oscillospiraceae bacterium]|jgi:UDP-2,3-diacylglucosamine pyrophosphatase LpxH|nr:serine/threonine protein phosphatase [Oscillospiraceae bacterium]